MKSHNIKSVEKLPWWVHYAPHHVVPDPYD